MQEPIFPYSMPLLADCSVLYNVGIYTLRNYTPYCFKTT